MVAEREEEDLELGLKKKRSNRVLGEEMDEEEN